MLYCGNSGSALAGGPRMYLKWRGSSLNCSFPVPGFPEVYPLGIKTTGSKSDIGRCWALGDELLSEIRVAVSKKIDFTIENGRLIDKSIKPEEKAPYRPTYTRLAMRYVFGVFWFTKYAHADWPKLRASITHFKGKFYDEITTRDIKSWIFGMRKKGVSENHIRNLFWQMNGVYRYANEEELENGKHYRKISYNPCTDAIEFLKKGNTRKFLLTPEMFERNYAYLKTINPIFALFYLMLWETGRRPLEVAQYRLENLNWSTQEILIPASITKTDEEQILPLSDRLWNEIKNWYGPKDTGLISYNSNGNPWLYQAPTHKKAVNNCAATWMRKLKAKFNDGVGWIRDNRGGFVTYMCDLVEPALVGALSGQSAKTVARYNKRTRDRMKAALKMRSLATPPTGSPSDKIVAFRTKQAKIGKNAPTDFRQKSEQG